MERAIYLGLGSNLGDRQAILREGLTALRRAGIFIERVSSLYKSAPVGPITDQPDFLNAVALLRTTLEPHDLLHLCLQVEDSLGRRREIDKGPRTLDLDLLLVGDLVLSTVDLTLPHPALTERAFVLEPLFDLDPQLRDPRDGRLLAEHLPRAKSRQLLSCLGSLESFEMR